jgi:hypothetical protein
MAEAVKPTKTVFTVTQFLDWQRSKTLDLKPIFQRRQVWKPSAKSLLIDSVVRGYPIPIIFLRQVQNLKSLSMKMEVVDGQQRLRTLLSYLEPESLPDFDPEHDKFVVRRMHNTAIDGRPFSRLPADVKHQILGYELSTHVFPATTGDDQVFRIFARLNSTGLRLKPQEIRNAEFHGAFKSLVYDLSFRHLNLWRKWSIFDDDAISRMDEAEAVSEYIIIMLLGITGKTQQAIRQIYKKYDEKFPQAAVVAKRLERVLGAIDEAVGDLIAASAFQRPVLFFSLFAAVYDHIYGLKSQLQPTRGKDLPGEVRSSFVRANKKIRAKELPEKVQDAIDKATTDRGRRDVRHRYLERALAIGSSVQS